MNLEELFSSNSMGKSGNGSGNGDKEIVKNFLMKISVNPSIDIATQKEAEKAIRAFERYCLMHGAEESGEDETGKEMLDEGWDA